MKSKKLLRTILPCLLLGCLFCSCRQQYYLPGGNYRRKPANNCGCPSYSQAAPLLRQGVPFQTVHGHQPVHAQFLPVGQLADVHEGR
ncbi:MAG: hypothetical protein NC396_03905 [Bacteroides sp.]|nr:hypothetical protein [Bacteroides sp.]MCM1085370.1 hypothetical protein [Bacteroides sp.]